MNNGRLQFFNLVKARSLESSVDTYIKRGDDYLKKQNHEPTLLDND